MTTCGCEIMITWEPSTSVIVAPARLAMERMTSLPAALSPVATTVQEGKVFQAGAPDGSEKAPSETGRWVAAVPGLGGGVGDHGPSVRVADGQDRAGNLIEHTGDVSGVDGEATQWIRGRSHLHPFFLQPLNHASPA